jgi:hypothetical protein
MINIQSKKRALTSFAGIILAIALFFSPVTKIPIFDTNTDSYFHEAITKAGVAYATCRAINASVSIIKDSDLQLEPAGLGVSLAIGQVLDPIDDMTERLSDVLVTAITSLGIQKLSYEICVALAPQIFSIILLLFSIVTMFENKQMQSLKKSIKRILILTAILRFCLPLSSIANDFLYKNYFAEQISIANDQLKYHSESSNQLGDITVSESTGFWATIGNSSSLIKNTSTNLTKTIKDFVTNTREIIDNLLSLTFLYAGIFLIQVIGLPILIFWLLVKFTNSLFDAEIPVILSHSKVSKNK